MALVYADAKAKIIEYVESKAKNKSKFYFTDFCGIFPEEKQRDVKKILSQMVAEEIMEYWSSGSTTLYGMKGAGKQAAAEHED